MSKTKIKSIERHQYALELSKVHYTNDASVELRKLINCKYGMPSSLQHAILSGNYKNIIKELRQACKPNHNNYKQVAISYSCDVYCNITDKIHHIKDKLAGGIYNNVSEILQLVNKKRKINDKPTISNLQFTYNFKLK